MDTVGYAEYMRARSEDELDRMERVHTLADSVADAVKKVFAESPMMWAASSNDRAYTAESMYEYLNMFVMDDNNSQ